MGEYQRQPWCQAHHWVIHPKFNQSPNYWGPNEQQLLRELTELYVRQMVLRDKAACNLDNIKFPKEKSGWNANQSHVWSLGQQHPVCKRKKLSTGSNTNQSHIQSLWQQQQQHQVWALLGKVLKVAEEVLYTNIEEHLAEDIQRIDQVICAGSMRSWIYYLKPTSQNR